MKRNLMFFGLLFLGISMIMISIFFILTLPNRQHVGFKELYAEVSGFSEKDERYYPIPKDTILLMNNEDYQKFKDEYFTQRHIPIKPPTNDKAVLYIQIPSSTDSVYTYCVHSINVKNNIITVTLENSGVGQVDSSNTLPMTWKWVMFIEIDKTNLKGNMQVAIKKIY